MSPPRVGSLVVPAPSFRQAMGTGEGAAVLFALRRGTGLLHYLDRDRAFWVPLRDVREIPRSAVPDGSLETLVSDLLLGLDAEECEPNQAEPGRLTLSVEVPGITRDSIRELQHALGEKLADLAVEPRNSHLVRLRLSLRSLPDAAGAGT